MNKISISAGVLPDRLIEGSLNAAMYAGTLVSIVAAGVIGVDAKDSASSNRDVLLLKEQDLSAGGNVKNQIPSGEYGAAIVSIPGNSYAVRVAAANNLASIGLGLSRDGAGALKLSGATDEILFVTEEVVNVTSARLVRVRRV